MDLRAYYQELRDVEASITEEFVVVVSKPTPDGGKAGIRTEVTPGVAARLVVEGRARLASAEESETYLAEVRDTKQRYDDAVASSRVKVTLIYDSELRALRDKNRPVKD